MAKNPKSIETLTHEEAKRKNIPPAEYSSLLEDKDQASVRVAYERRNRDLDPQLVWRGKDEQDWSDLVVQAPPLFIQEKIHPKVLIDDLKAVDSDGNRVRLPDEDDQIDLFGDFNGIADENAKTEFYQHDAHWSNRMILGDSLQVMASLAEREGLRGQVQCIYIDPPYGIKFNSNFQWSTTTRDVKDGKADHITREPEQVKAFRDTWRDGIHSYLTYLRDRLTVARDLLTESGSVFVQIGDENVHRVRAMMDEIFGDSNFVTLISVAKTKGATSLLLPNTLDYIIWYSKNYEQCKYRKLVTVKSLGQEGTSKYSHVEFQDLKKRTIEKSELFGVTSLPNSSKSFLYEDLTSQTGGDTTRFSIHFDGRKFIPSKRRGWRTHVDGIERLRKSSRLLSHTNVLMFKRYLEDFSANYMNNIWTDTSSGSSVSDPKVYVVQTRTKIIERCVLMTTDPGDLVLDPTCGSGTTAYVAEQWGRRWITIDTSRVALALARARIMGARYPYYTLADSREGQLKEAELSRAEPTTAPTHGDIRQGFVYERVPHITLKSIANNAEIDVIWDKWQQHIQPLLEQLGKVSSGQWIVDSGTTVDSDQEAVVSNTDHKPLTTNHLEEWEVPRDFPEEWPEDAKPLHAEFWKLRIARQKEIDASIAAKADYEYLYDKPYEDKKKVRVAGPFTVDSLSPHRTLTMGPDDELIDPSKPTKQAEGDDDGFVAMILENLRTSGVQQVHKGDKIEFTSLTPWPGSYICAEGVFHEGNAEDGTKRRAGIFIGPEFGTVDRQHLVRAAKEAADAGYDVVIACAFNFDAHATEFDKLGRIPVLKARMNADLHMAEDLKNTGKGNLFVIFGEPDIVIKDAEGGMILVQVKGVDVFDPSTGEIRSDDTDGIACWFIDTNYNDESFFVRHAYFLGQNDPYKALKTTLKAEINQDAWDTLNSDTSRPFPKPDTGRIAVKVINHLGDEVMKVYQVN